MAPPKRRYLVAAWLPEVMVKRVTVGKEYRDWDATLSPKVRATELENGGLPVCQRKPKPAILRDWANTRFSSNPYDANATSRPIAEQKTFSCMTTI